MPEQLEVDADVSARRGRADMTLTELIDLCEVRINGLSRTRQAFEHGGAPEQVARMLADLGVTASGWDAAVARLPDGDPGAVRAGARAVRDGAPGFGAVAAVLDTYASALEAGRARHAAGVAGLRVAQRRAAELPAFGSGGDPTRAEDASGAAIGVLDLACAGYAACQDAYEAARDAETALYAALAHVRLGRPGHVR
ncbi:hypothetical protein ACFS27_10440 [Promicromonospora vindobonensis]|uniref:Uncharacterized protein n=1 Tax=Promicromonospora vindobonensis TaxID=195748 RepID=A0ABW5VQL6_9MICO